MKLPPDTVVADCLTTARILVVDDEPAIRESIARVLRRQGYEVACAGSGEEALEEIDNSPLPFDLVISDVVMRGMSGAMLVEHVRSRDESMPLILISGYPGTHLDQISHVLDRSDLIEKPFSPKQLTARVHEKIHRALARTHLDGVGA